MAEMSWLVWHWAGAGWFALVSFYVFGVVTMLAFRTATRDRRKEDWKMAGRMLAVAAMYFAFLFVRAVVAPGRPEDHAIPSFTCILRAVPCNDADAAAY